MREVLRRIALLAALPAMLAGCTGAGPVNRSAVLDELNPAPMSAAAWSRVCWTYSGPIRASTQRNGIEGLSQTDTRLELSGPVDAPGVVFRMDRGFSTGWTPYGEWKGNFTNIPSMRYGSQGTVDASTHAPNQLLLVLRRDSSASREGSWMILTFRPNGNVDVDWIGRIVAHAGIDVGPMTGGCAAL
jgi:hypothetical protein